MSEVKKFLAKDFYKIDSQNSTLLDVREPSEAIVRPVNGALQVPFFELSKKIDSIPKDKPVYVFCSTGDRSEEVAEIFADRDYDVYNVEGGLDAIPKVHFVDAKGLKCPGPIVKVDEAVKSVSVGEEVQVEATEKAFFSDVDVWCQRTGNELKSLSEKDGVIYATIVKRDAPQSLEKRDFEHGKTFVVFSGDLDKAIAFHYGERSCRHGTPGYHVLHLLGSKHFAQARKGARQEVAHRKNVWIHDAPRVAQAWTLPDEFWRNRSENDLCCYEEKRNFFA